MPSARISFTAPAGIGFPFGRVVAGTTFAAPDDFPLPPAFEPAAPTRARTSGWISTWKGIWPISDTSASW